MGKKLCKVIFMSLIATLLLFNSCSLNSQDTGDITLSLPTSRAATNDKFTITLINSSGNVENFDFVVKDLVTTTDGKSKVTIKNILIGKYTVKFEGTLAGVLYEGETTTTVKPGNDNSCPISLHEKIEKFSLITPIITFEPKELSIKQNDKSNFISTKINWPSKMPEGSYKLNYQWYYKNIDENTEYIKFSGATSSSLYPDTSTVGRYSYKCEVTVTVTDKFKELCINGPSIKAFNEIKVTINESANPEPTPDPENKLERIEVSLINSDYFVPYNLYPIDINQFNIIECYKDGNKKEVTTEELNNYTLEPSGLIKNVGPIEVKITNKKTNISSTCVIDCLFDLAEFKVDVDTSERNLILNEECILVASHTLQNNNMPKDRYTITYEWLEKLNDGTTKSLTKTDSYKIDTTSTFKGKQYFVRVTLAPVNPKECTSIGNTVFESDVIKVNVENEPLNIPESIEVTPKNSNSYVIFGEKPNLNAFNIKEVFADGSKVDATNTNYYNISPSIITEDNTTIENGINKAIITITHKNNQNITATVNIPYKYHLITPTVSVSTNGNTDINLNDNNTVLTAKITNDIASINRIMPQGSYDVTYDWYKGDVKVSTYTPTIQEGLFSNSYTVLADKVGSFAYSCVVSITPKAPEHCVDTDKVQKGASDPITIVVTDNTPPVEGNYLSTDELQAKIDATQGYSYLTLSDNYIISKPVTFKETIKIIADKEVTFKRDPSFKGNMFEITVPIEIGPNPEVGKVSSRMIFDGNNVANTGSIFNVKDGGGTLKLGNCTLQNNKENLTGGGAVYSTGSLTMTDCLVINNSTTKTGGGIFIGNGQNKLTNVEIKNNTATLKGGAMAIYSNAADVKLFNSNSTTITGNKVTSQDGLGGGIYMEGGVLQLSSTTVINGNTVVRKTGNGANLYMTTANNNQAKLNGGLATKPQGFDGEVNGSTKPQ